MFKEIKTAELKDLIDSGQDAVIIEALPRRYYLENHLPGAINIPHDDIQNQAAEKLPQKDATIVVYCANTACQNSRIAAQTLDRLGYTNVYEYVDGKQAWEEAGNFFESQVAQVA